MKNFNDDDFKLTEFQRFEGHTGKVLGVLWKVGTGNWGSPAVIAFWSDDKTIRIWEQNFSGFFVYKVSCSVRSCAWSPGGCKLLAAACSDASTAIWKDVGVHSYERIYTLKQLLCFPRRGSIGNNLSIFGVGVRSAYTLFSRDSTLWDYNGELHHAPLDEEENTEIFASVGADDVIRVFIENKDNEVDGLTFKLLLKKEKAHEMNVNSLKCHAGDKRFLASASDDGTEKIWEFVCPSPQWQG